MKFCPELLGLITKQLVKKKFRSCSFSRNDVTNYVGDCENLCEKLQKWVFFKNKDYAGWENDF